MTTVNLTCPRCATLVEEHLEAVVDSHVGIIAVTASPVPATRRHCLCGWFSWWLTSAVTTVRQPALTLIEGAA